MNRLVFNLVLFVLLLLPVAAFAQVQVQPVQGAASNNSAITEWPVLTAGEAITPGNNPTPATTGNQRQILVDTEGVRVGSANPFSCFVENVTVTTQCQAAPAANMKAYVTSIILSNEAATVQSLAAGAFDEQVVRFLDSSGLGNHPAAIKLMAWAGRVARGRT